MTAKHVQPITPELELKPTDLGTILSPDSSSPKEVFLPSLQSLSHWLGSPITPGQMIEWGMPLRLNLRNIILSFLAPQSHLCLWVNGDLTRTAYPPAWAAKHIHLDDLYFIQCDDPIRRLRPVFFDSTFKIIILDAPKNLYKNQMAFLSQAIRQSQSLLFILRPYYLSKKTGNPFAKKRINAFWKPLYKHYSLQSIKGALPNPLTINQQELYESFS